MAEDRSCVECGGPLPEGSRPNTKLCSDGCRRARHNRRHNGGGREFHVVRPMACIHCETPISQSRARRVRYYCGPACAATSSYTPSVPQTKDCVICGGEFRSHMPHAKYCSSRCGDSPPVGPPRPKVCASCGDDTPGTRHTFCVDCRDRPTLGPPEPLMVSCVQCGEVFRSHNGARYCSDECRRLRNIGKVMGLYNAAVENLEIRQACYWQRQLRAYLADRDGSRCAICGAPVDLELPSGPRGDDMGASIDHVVPRSLGGSDDLANLQLAHWACNRSKRAGCIDDGEQLRLVG